MTESATSETSELCACQPAVDEALASAVECALRYAAAMEALGGDVPPQGAQDPALVPCAPPEYVDEAKAYDAAHTRLDGARRAKALLWLRQLRELSLITVRACRLVIDAGGGEQSRKAVMRHELILDAERREAYAQRGEALLARLVVDGDGDMAVAIRAAEGRDCVAYGIVASEETQ